MILTKRIIYFLIAVILVALMIHVVEPYLMELTTLGNITENEYNLYYMGAFFGISIVIGIIMMIEGSYFQRIYVIVIVLILTRAVDFWHYYAYPDASPIRNYLSAFGGGYIIIFSISLIIHKLLSKRFAVYMMMVGLMTLIRFPWLTDVVHLYLKNYAPYAEAANMYFTALMYIHYVLLFFEVLALDVMTKDNPNMFKPRKAMTEFGTHTN